MNNIKEYNNLTEEEKELLEVAKKACQTSFSKQSSFSVGAALLLIDPDNNRQIVPGNNYETEVYQSVCAERHALHSANLYYTDQAKLLKMAVFSKSTEDFILPCGICRQSIIEKAPNLEILCFRQDGAVKIFTAQELLPHAFGLESAQSDTCSHTQNSNLIEPTQEVLDYYAPYIVHFPVTNNRLGLLKGVSKILFVGSPTRAQKLADYLPGEFAEYCHIASGNTDREYSIFADPVQSMAIVSHGIGASGIEICLAEVSALIALANGEINNNKTPIKYAIRSGTRGTINGDIKLGTIALSSETMHDSGDIIIPDTSLAQCVRDTAKSQNIELIEGKCLSAQFFWANQGRYSLPLREKGETDEPLLRKLQEQDVYWIEMEDYYLNYFSRLYGIASASVGLVIAQRYNKNTDKFELSYDGEIKKQKELIPADLAYQALTSV